MKLLSRAEEIILVTILKLEDEAYGVSIREQIYQDTGDQWSFASIYTPLDKLVTKKFVEKSPGEPTAERGGKRKFYYRVTRDGKLALLKIQAAQKQVWTGVPRIILD